MPRVNVKEIKEQCDKMSAGWKKDSTDEFNGIKRADFDADRTNAQALDDEIEQDEAALKMKKDRRVQKYVKLGSDRVKVGKGVAGHKDYGDDSELYGGMGFVRKSERKSGLTRGKKSEGGVGNG
jgi:hypothetical protein